MSYLKFVTIIFLNVSCGTYEVPKTEVKEAEGQCGAGKRICSSGTTNDNKVVDTKEKVKIQQEESFIFNYKKRTWQEVLDKTPNGYKLATRADVIDLLDSGDLDDIIDEMTGIWTGSESRQLSDMAWVVSLYNEFEAAKTLEFSAIYIAE